MEELAGEIGCSVIVGAAWTSLGRRIFPRRDLTGGEAQEALRK